MVIPLAPTHPHAPPEHRPSPQPQPTLRHQHIKGGGAHGDAARARHLHDLEHKARPHGRQVREVEGVEAAADEGRDGAFRCVVSWLWMAWLRDKAWQGECTGMALWKERAACDACARMCCAPHLSVSRNISVRLDTSPAWKRARGPHATKVACGARPGQGQGHQESCECK